MSKTCLAEFRTNVQTLTAMREIYHPEQNVISREEREEDSHRILNLTQGSLPQACALLGLEVLAFEGGQFVHEVAEPEPEPDWLNPVQ
jgi:hypothetical protein